MQLDFWTRFKEYATSRKSSLRLRKVYPQHWYDVSIGNSKSNLTLIVDADNDQIRCEFYIPDSKALFNALLSKKETIESKLPYELEWMELEGKKASRIRTLHTIDLSSIESWDTAFQWLMETSENFQTVFAEQMKKMKI